MYFTFTCALSITGKPSQRSGATPRCHWSSRTGGGGLGGDAARDWTRAARTAQVREARSKFPSWMRRVRGVAAQRPRDLKRGDGAAPRRQAQPPGAMSGGSGANSSWTILTSEETVAETLRPLAEGPQRHGEGLTSAAGSGADPPAETPPVEGQVASEEQTAPLLASTSAGDALSQSEGLPEGPSQAGPDPDSFSDSCTHISTSPDEPPASLLSAETLEGGEFIQEGERLPEEGAPHPRTGEELQQEGTAPDPSQSISGQGKPTDSSVDSVAGEGGEPEVRRRSLLAALEQIGRTEEEEVAEEEFQLPRPEEGSAISLNKCILGAVILLGLGTVFFSGFLMDLDGDSDYGTRELRDAEVPGKQEWLNAEVPPVPADADSTEMLNKISVLQAQVQQAQKEELKVAKGQAAEGAERRWEEVEKENSRLKTEMASFPVLQKENERMKRELESVPALQKELETLRTTVTQLKVSSATSDASVKPTTSPPSGQAEDSRPAEAGTADKHARKEKDRKKDKYDTGEKRNWKEREMSERREGEKKDGKDAGKHGKREHGKVERAKDKEGAEKKQKEKERKKEKAVRGDEGKTWKAREGKKEWMERSERREEKEWKKTKHDKVGEGKQWREKTDWKRGDEHGERHKGREDWNGENERKKVKGGLKEKAKEKRERKEWKSKDGKEWEEGRARGERKQWEQSENHGKRHGNGRKEEEEESRQWDEHEWRGKNTNGRRDWRRKEGGTQWAKRGERPRHRGDHDHGEEPVWGGRGPPHTRPSPQQPQYWLQRRARLQRGPRPHCGSLEACARAQGLRPVPLGPFQAVLQRYLAKAEGAGLGAEPAEQLRALTREFFADGLFAHDRISFRDFAEDVSDILEHMVEGGGGEEEEGGEDSAIEEEMEEFEREVLQKFSAGEREDGGVTAGEGGRKERGRGRG
ncbi:pre-B-cell leukemia homeobox interacting protein 1b isoform X3 [Betta splendens]|uniref:Pre-B-cell leukemia homeobox interacting protein 1b isoform X3 n=1 Tax=Betta splendens TaxID=158456 RepID=A0A6P7KZH3_BETSP|nr:pre-B-cell leukemia homeobox interacting protein 1b isoform X3 [Betta splendens]